jgi:hypothetical protein
LVRVRFFQELRRLVVDGEEAVGVAGDDLGHADDEIGRVQPCLALGIQVRRRFGDDLRAGVGGVGGVGGSGDVGAEAFGEGEGLEGGGRGVAGTIFQRAANRQRPPLVNAR